MTTSRRAEMRLFREMAIKVEQRIKNTKEDTVDTLIPEKVPDPIPEVIPIEDLDFDCDETATSETLLTDVIPPSAVPPPSELLSPDLCMALSPASPKRASEHEFPSPKLIRSNSYTLDHPSPMLLKFLGISGNIPVSATEPTTKRLNKSACSTLKTPSPGNRKKTPRKLSDPAKLRGIYGIQKSPIRRSPKNESLDDTKRRLTIHSKGEKVEKFFMRSKTVKEFENLTKTKVISDSSESSPEKNLKEILLVCDENKENVAEAAPLEDTIIADREEQQKRVLDELNSMQRQKQLLLMQKLEELNLMERTSTPVERMISAEDSQSEEAGGGGGGEAEEDHRLNETSFYSTIRGESPVCSMSLVSDAYSKQYLLSIRSFTVSPTPQSFPGKKENQEIAATIINSHVRGYLIRRLLRTEFVQNIIDNIKNILFLILDANPKEIQLKRSYLMKLNGNCERLHDVFFQFNTKERMEVIHKDRELLLAKLSQRRMTKRPASGTKLAIK